MTWIPKLVVLDLDGTLLGSDSAVSARNAAVLRAAHDAGTRVVIATGRPPRWIEPLRRDIPAAIALCCNGGLVLDLETDTVQAAFPVDGARLLEAIEGLRADGIGFSVGVEGAPEFGIAVETDFPYRSDTEVRRVPVAELCSGEFVKVLVRPDPAAGQAQRIVDRLERDYGADFTLTRSTNDGLIEMSRAGITKGAVIDGLARSWGIAASDAIAFGDMPNDIEMLRWAGRAVAMGNADASVKAIADEIAGHHDEDGVAGVLERWFPPVVLGSSAYAG